MPILPISDSYRMNTPEKEYDSKDVDLENQNENTTSIDPSTGAKVTVNEDESVTIDFSPETPKKKKTDKFGANLALEIEDYELSSVAEGILQGIDNDIQSRADWEGTYQRGIQLMGIKLEDASSEVSSTGNISKVYSTLLIETTVRYQSNASAELLPASGPVKVSIATPKTTQEQEELAQSFEKDFNYYLTQVAKEYYPDTNQLLFNQGWSGQAYKKVFYCPIRKRPCSDLVLAPDLIVSNDVVDLETAERVTHRTYLSNGMIRRLQKAKIYRKVDLGQPVEQPTDVERKVAEVSGIDISTKLPIDHRHTIYECYVNLDLPGYEDDVPLPYCVTIDKDSRQILSIYRNWEKDDPEKTGECPFVKYGMIPAFGFYDLGFVHLLGNTTRALTAILRMQLDAGQFSIFPGFLFSKQAGKQVTNEIRISPGTGKEIDTGGLPIQQAAMPLPYPGPSQVLASLSEKVAEDGMRLGGASQVEVGEGRADVPVGTTMALIEQSTKVMAAVHKRNHTSQQREFGKLRKLFNKYPDSLSKFSKNPARKWQAATEFADFELVPASDPNIPSQTHRLMQANALVQMAQGAPGVFNPRAVATRALNTIGIKDVDTLLAAIPPPGTPPPPPPPEIQLKMQDNQIKQQQMQLTAQQQATHDQARIQEMQMDNITREKDRQSREKLELMKIESDKQKHANALKMENTKHIHGLISDHLKHDTKLNADHAKHMGGIIADHKQHVSGLMADAHEQIREHGMRREEMASAEKQASAKKSVDAKD